MMEPEARMVTSWAPILRAASSAFTSSYWPSGQPSVSRRSGLGTGLPARSRASRKSSSNS